MRTHVLKLRMQVLCMHTQVLYMRTHTQAYAHMLGL